MNTLRTFIYGSCVSRDTFEYLDAGRFELAKYVARQSLVSAFSPSNDFDFPEIRPTSQFQERMLIGDWHGNMPSLLEAHRDAIDLLLWDIFDERMGVYEFPHDIVVTRSVDAISTGLDDTLKVAGSLASLGSPRHLTCFSDALALFANHLTALGLLERTIVVAPPWATHFTDGSPTPTSFGLSPSDANHIFETYYALIDRELGIPQVRGMLTGTTGATDHKWGPAAFHYTPSTYESIAAQIALTAKGLYR